MCICFFNSLTNNPDQSNTGMFLVLSHRTPFCIGGLRPRSKNITMTDPTPSYT